MGRIAVAGHVCVDLTPALDHGARIAPGQLIGVGPLTITLGGCVGNTGSDLAALGLAIEVHAAVGDDELGRLVARMVADRPGLGGTLQVVPGHATSYSLVVEPRGLDRTFWHHTGANDAFTGAEVDTLALDLLHVGYPPLLPGLLPDRGAPLAHLLERAKAAGATTSLDLAVVDPDSDVGRLDWEGILRRVLPACDVVSPSLDDLTSALGPVAGSPGEVAARFADRLVEWGAGVVAISGGNQGLLLRTADGARLQRGGRVLGPIADRWADLTLHTPALPVESVATTTGAGDASTAGLLFALCRSAGPESAARMATATAAAVIAGRRPTPAEIVRIRPDLLAMVGPIAKA